MSQKLYFPFFVIIYILSCTLTTYATDSKNDNQNANNTIAEKCNYALTWYRKSLEMKAIHYQTYHLAISIINEKIIKENLKPGTWGIVADLDATILDTSWIDLKHDHIIYPKRMNYFRNDKTYTSTIPGTLSFLSEVAKLGGYISFVTNRDISVKISTKHMLKRLKIPYNQVIFYSQENKKKSTKNQHLYKQSKNERFNAIINGKLPSLLPAHQVIMFLGDSMNDFPDMENITQESYDKNLTNEHLTEKFKKFGTEYLMLPNPVYGSWTEHCQ